MGLERVVKLPDGDVIAVHDRIHLNTSHPFLSKTDEGDAFAQADERTNFTATCGQEPEGDETKHAILQMGVTAVAGLIRYWNGDK